MAARRRLSRVPWRSGWHLTPSYGERLGGGAVCPLCRETASSEAEMSHPLEGRSATLERGGGVLRGRGSRGEPSSEAEFVTHSRVDLLPSSEAEFVQRALEGPSSAAEIVSRVRGGCEWAARWTSLSPFLSFGWEAGRGPLWAQLP